MNTMNLIKTAIKSNSDYKKPVEIIDNKNISVLLVEDKSSRQTVLKKGLIDLNYHVIKTISFKDSFIEQVELCNPTVLILSTKVLSDKTLKDLAEIDKTSPLPIVIFSDSDSPNIIKCAIKAGVSAFIVHEVLPKSLSSIISVASERFKELQALRSELRQAQNQLESRKLIARAKGLIMDQKQISENQAYELLRKMAMNQSCSLAIVAKNIINVCEVLSTTRS
jgi:response regulator NasT